MYANEQKMNAPMYANEQKMNRSKLFAAIAVFAMIACAFAVIIPADGVNGDALSTSDAPAANEEAGVVHVTDAKGFSDALANKDVKTIVINVTPEEDATGPTVLDLSSSTVTIPEGKTVYIGATYSDNGSPKDGTNDVDKTTVQVKFGKLVVEGDVYNLLGSNKKTTGLWIENLTMSGAGNLFSTSAISATDGVTDRNGFYTSTPYAADTYRQYYAAQLSDIVEFVTDNKYDGQGITTAEKAIFSYGTTSVTSADNEANLSGIGVYLNPDSTMTVEEGATLAPSKVVVKVDSKDDTRAATLVNNGKTILGANSQIAGTYTNNGTTTVTGTVTGTIDNENGTVTTSVNPGAGLTIVGGDMTFADKNAAINNMPSVSTGVVVDVGGKKYTANVSTSNDYTLVFGVPAPQYNPDMDYAGDPALDIVILNVKDLQGNNVKFANAPVTILEKSIQPGDDGKATVAGQYDMMFRVSANVYDATNILITNFSATVNGTFTILPMEITDVQIVGTGENGAFPPVFYDDGNEVWLQPGDFKVTATVNGVKDVELILDQDYTYECVSADGKWAGSADIVVTLGDNYTTATGKEISETYTISKNMVDMTVTLKDEAAKFYTGEAIDKTDFQFIGNYEDGSKTQITAGGDYIDPASEAVTITGSQYYGVPGEDGKYVVQFIYKYGETEIFGECSVTVIPIEKIEITENTSKDQYYKDTYNAGESFDPEGMTITVTYVAQEGEEAGATVTLNYAKNGTAFKATGNETLADKTFSSDVAFDYGTFNKDIGEVPVTATYFEKDDSIFVNVNGFIATYMYLNLETNEYDVYGTQVGNVGDPQPVKGGWQLFVLHGERIALQGMIFPRAPHTDRDDENGDDCRNDNTCDHFFLPPYRHFLALLTVIIP